MKIVYLSSSTIPSRAANSIHVMKMCQAFARNGNEVVLIAPNREGRKEPGINDVFAFYGVEQSFSIIKLPWIHKGWGYIYSPMAAVKAKRLYADLVYCRDIRGCFFSARLGLPVIFEAHHPLEDSGKFAESFFRKLIVSAKLKKLVTITHALAEYYVAHYQLPSSMVHTAPDGADPVNEQFTPIVLSNHSCRLQVGYVGHMYKGRGVDVIIGMAEKCPWADFHLVGGVQADIDQWRDAASGLPNVFFHGFVPPFKAERFRITFDVLLAPYQEKVFVAGDGSLDTGQWMSPLKVFEYMAAGKAILSSDIPVLREVLEHGSNALLCPPQDVLAWVYSLERLRDDPEFRMKLGRNAQEKFLNQYTWAVRARKVLETP
jgi:glycosyltransferase involved in cell wall biosynthesis